MNTCMPAFIKLVWLRNRATSGRSCVNPLGNDSRPYVANGNLLAARTALLVLLAAGGQPMLYV